MYLPFEYRKSDVIPLQWKDLKNLIRVEYCYSEGNDWYCEYSTEKEEVKEFLKHFEDIKELTDKLKEFLFSRDYKKVE